MSFALWQQILNDAVSWQEINEHIAMDLYHRTAVAWGSEKSYWLQSGSQRVELTKLYEQYKMITNLKEAHHGKNQTHSG